MVEIVEPKEPPKPGRVAFARIRSLSEDQLTYVNNWLTTGGEVSQLARHIQQQWSLFQDTAERTFIQQLMRYREWLGAQGTKEMVDPSGTFDIKRTRTRQIDVMERLVTLVTLQERRLTGFLESEQKMKMPLPGVDKVIDSTKELLKDIQKIRFDLGMDTFQGVVPGVQMRAATQTTTNADGSSTTSTLYEAMLTAEQVLKRANITTDMTILEEGRGS